MIFKILRCISSFFDMFVPQSKYNNKILQKPLKNRFMNTWDSKKWLKDFNRADTQFSNQIDLFSGYNTKKDLRRVVFESTLKITVDAEYHTEKKVTLNKDNDFQNVIKNSVFYDDTTSLITSTATKYPTQFSVIDADCLEVANLLRKMGKKPVVLNMANAKTPGGGVLGGAGAQEENLFRRSNMHLSLYQYADFALKYDIPKNSSFQYPLSASGGIYSKGITVFRSSEVTGYSLLDEPYTLDFIAVAAIYNPPLVRIENKLYLDKNCIEDAKTRLRTILKIAIAQNHTTLVLSAIGCGAFANPPAHIAALFQEMFEEIEFKNVFEMVVFAIFNDHNSHQKHNPEGNVIPFQQIFG